MNTDSIKILAAAILQEVSYRGGRCSDGSYYETAGITQEGVGLLKAALEGNIVIDPEYFKQIEIVKSMAKEIREDHGKYSVFNRDSRLVKFYEEKDKLSNMVRSA